MKIFRKQYHPPGTAPGTLKQSTPRPEKPLSKAIQIDLVSYNNSEIDSYQNIPIEDCQAHLKPGRITWFHVSGWAKPEHLTLLSHQFDLHPLALEDIVNHGQRPKIEQYDKQLFIIVNRPVISANEIYMEQISLFCGEGYVISFHDQSDNSSYGILHTRLHKNANHIRRYNSGYLLYVLLDLIVDNGFPVLEWFGDKLELVEESLMHKQARNTLPEIHQLKRELIFLRRALWPQREVINTLLKDDISFISKETQFYLRDCYDHTIQIMELIESYRDMASGILDVYLTTVSYRLNEVMRFLTVLSTLFIPPTFLVGVYGMNFRQDAGRWNMPELSWPYGYLLVWLVMLVMMVAMLAYFKRKGWF